MGQKCSRSYNINRIMKVKYNIIEVLHGVTLPVYTWGTVTEDSCVMVGTTKLAVTNTLVISGAPEGSIVLLLWRQGIAEVLKVGSSRKCTEASVTVGGGGYVTWAAEGSEELLGGRVYPSICTMRFNIPTNFLESLMGDNFGLFVPETSVLNIVRVGFPANRHAALVGIPNFNKVHLLGGRLMRSPEFMASKFESLFLVSGECIRSLGGIAWLRQFECVAEGGKVFVPGTDIEVYVEDLQDGITYIVTVPEQLLSVKEPLCYYPYHMNGEPMYSAADGSKAYDVSKFIRELSDLSNDVDTVKELFPKVCELREILPQIAKEDGNTVAKIIELACSYFGVSS